MSSHELLSVESEAGFRALFEFATVGILVINRDGQIELANPCLRKMFGYSNAELIGQPVEILIPESLREAHESHRADYFEKPKARPMGLGLELFARRKSGEEFPVEISLGHYQLDGETLAMAFVTDITERKRDHEERLQSEERFAKVFDSSPVAKSISRLEDGVIIDVNESFLSLFEYTRDEVIGQSTIGLKLFKDAADRMDLIHALRNRRIIQNREMTVYSKSMKPVHILLSAAIIMLEGKEHLLTTRVDISEKKKAEDEMLRVNRELEQRVAERTLELTESLQRERELSEMKSRFVSMASHEFRTPLSAILSSASLVDRYAQLNDEEKRKKHVARIKSSVQMLNDILSDFLSLDKLDQGKVEVNRTMMDLNETARGVIEEVNFMQKAGQEIFFTHHGEHEIFQDRKILSNVLLNLLSNAIKYSGQNSPINVTIEVTGKDVIITVSDSGIGISEEEQEHLFSKFFRAKNAMSLTGSGLGLNIVKRYLDLISGTIRFTSELNKGTTFIVTLAKMKME